MTLWTSLFLSLTAVRSLLYWHCHNNNTVNFDMYITLYCFTLHVTVVKSDCRGFPLYWHWHNNNTINFDIYIYIYIYITLYCVTVHVTVVKSDCNKFSALFTFRATVLKWNFVMYFGQKMYKFCVSFSIHKESIFFHVSGISANCWPWKWSRQWKYGRKKSIFTFLFI
jgi:hypothetical protein